jgi:hypothetical protein
MLLHKIIKTDKVFQTYNVLRNWKMKCQPIGIPVQNTYIHVYSHNYADYKVLLAQDHDVMEYMARKLKEEYEKWGLDKFIKKNQI